MCQWQATRDRCWFPNERLCHVRRALARTSSQRAGRNHRLRSRTSGSCFTRRTSSAPQEVRLTVWLVLCLFDRFKASKKILLGVLRFWNQIPDLPRLCRSSNRVISRTFRSLSSPSAQSHAFHKRPQVLWDLTGPKQHHPLLPLMPGISRWKRELFDAFWRNVNVSMRWFWWVYRHFEGWAPLQSRIHFNIF